MTTMPSIDLRSDTVTKPTPAMLAAMAKAPVGDDVYGEDPTVNHLQEQLASMVGTEAALFATSGTQSNLLALMSHCQRGDEYIVGQQAHTYKFEGGGAAVLGSIQPQPIEMEGDGSLSLVKVEAAIKPDDIHFARTTLLCLENTHNGLALPADYFQKAGTLCREKGLKLHLDGARLFNALVKQQLPIQAITQHVDSVSLCLSKGLGAPVGSVLCGSHRLIARAKRWRKVLGGGLRQAGILAAAGIYALEHHTKRLAEDHTNAELLARGLATFPQLEVSYLPNQTNMVFVQVKDSHPEELRLFLQHRGIIIPPGHHLRLVTHLDINREDITTVIKAFYDFFQ